MPPTDIKSHLERMSAKQLTADASCFYALVSHLNPQDIRLRPELQDNDGGAYFSLSLFRRKKLGGHKTLVAQYSGSCPAGSLLREIIDWEFFYAGEQNLMGLFSQLDLSACTVRGAFPEDRFYTVLGEVVGAAHARLSISPFV